MKTYLIISIAILSLTACNQAELEKTSHEKDSLIAVVNERNSVINDFIVAFNEVEGNLDSVASKQNLISLSTDKQGELKQNQKARINAEIAAINELMDQNRKKIDELTRKAKNSSNKNVQLEKAIAIIKNQMIEKDIELTALNEKLTNLNAQVAQLETSVNTLNIEGAEKSRIIAEETMALHTAYFIVGKSKDLEDKQIIDRKGGLLGIGKTSKLTSNIDNNKFTRIDYTETTSIPVNSEDVKIITSHANDSYSLEKDVQNEKMIKTILISNPEKFWSASKYLVVVNK